MVPALWRLVLVAAGAAVAAGEVDEQCGGSVAARADVQMEGGVPRPAGGKSCLLQRDGRLQSQEAAKEHGSLEAATSKAKAKVELETLAPAHIIDLGTRLLGSREAMEAVVQDSFFTTVDYAGASLKLRLKTGDNALSRLPDEGREDGYGLANMTDLTPPKGQFLDLLDMGANYGVVPIALYKLFPGKVRAVIIEPIPVTYFFLRWNLWLNGIAELTEAQIQGSSPGMLALHGGVTEDQGETLSFCWKQDNSMNALRCDCEQPPYPPMECLSIKGYGTDYLMGLFKDSTVDLLKMDCEGCERHSLPALMKFAPGKVKRFMGELHDPTSELEDMACKLPSALQLVTKVCRMPRGAGQQLECDPSTRSDDCYIELPWPSP